MGTLDEIKENIAYVKDGLSNLRVMFQNITTYMEDYSGRVYSSDAQLITCKDCKHSQKDGTLCQFFASYAPIAGGDEYEEVPAVVEPDGFCAWAERKES